MLGAVGVGLLLYVLTQFGSVVLDNEDYYFLLGFLGRCTVLYKKTGQLVILTPEERAYFCSVFRVISQREPRREVRAKLIGEYAVFFAEALKDRTNYEYWVSQLCPPELIAEHLLTLGKLG